MHIYFFVWLCLQEAFAFSPGHLRRVRLLQPSHSASFESSENAEMPKRSKRFFNDDDRNILEILWQANPVCEESQLHFDTFPYKINFEGQSLQKAQVLQSHIYDEEGNTVFHFSHRYNESNTVITSRLLDGDWNPSPICKFPSLARGNPFLIEIFYGLNATSPMYPQFEIYVNLDPPCIFQAIVPFRGDIGKYTVGEMVQGAHTEADCANPF